MIRKAVDKAYGNFLHSFITNNSSHQYKSLLTGFIATMFLQSSGATALIVASLANQSVLNVTTGIGMLLGADLGTAVIAQFLSLKILWLPAVLFISGYFIHKTAKTTKKSSLGEIIIGIGFILLSLQLIADLTETIKSSAELISLLEAFESRPIIAFIFAIIITWVFHSSLATILLVSGLALSEAISIQLAFIFVLAANVGSGLMPLMINLKESIEAKRILTANFIIRTIWAIICFIFISQIVIYSGELGNNSATQVLHFHLLFNIILLVIAYPFIGLLSKLSSKIVTETVITEDKYAPQYLHNNGLKNTTIGLSNASRETIRMGGLVEMMLEHTKQYLDNHSEGEHYEEVSILEDRVDELFKGIRDYLIIIGQQELSAQDSIRHDQLMSYVINLEHAADLVETSLMNLIHRKVVLNISFSKEGYKEIMELYDRLLHNFQTAASLLMQPNRNEARDLMNNKSKFSQSTRDATESHLNRLKQGNTTSVESSSLHLDILRDFKQINSHICSIAYPILEYTGDLYKNRLKSINNNEETT